MLSLSSRISSYFLIHSFQKNKNYPTFILGILSIQLLAGIAWWWSRSMLFMLVPLITTFILPDYFIHYFFFWGISLYCGIVDHNYKKAEQNLLLEPQSGHARVEEISYKEENKNYSIICSFNPYESTSSSTIKIVTPESLDLSIGDVLEVKNLIFTKFISDTYRKYLKKESIHGISYSKHLNYHIIDNTISWYQRTKKYLFYLEQTISKKTSSACSYLFNSLFLGSKKNHSDTEPHHIKKYFDIWGICHFLARSGLHVALILNLIFYINKLGGLSLLYSNAITLIFLLFYVLFSYSSVSFYRAVIAAFYSLWCSGNKVPLHLFHILLVCLVTLLVYNPFYIFFLDFQLTFLLTFGLCSIYLLNS